MKAKKLNIGDILYHYASINGIFEYVVIEVRESKDNIQYLIECQSCEHGIAKCRLLVVKHESPYKNGVYKFVTMTGSEEENNEHYIWHNECNYFLHKNYALIDRAQCFIIEKYEKLNQAKIKFEVLEKEHQELKKYISDLIFEVENNSDMAMREREKWK